MANIHFLLKLPEGKSAVALTGSAHLCDFSHSGTQFEEVTTVYLWVMLFSSKGYTRKM